MVVEREREMAVEMESEMVGEEREGDCCRDGEGD